MPHPSHPDWYCLMPGVYDDNRGGLHIVMPEFLAGHGYVDTPENRATLTKVIREQFGQVPITEDED